MDNIGKLSTEPHPSTNLNLPRCIFLLPSRSWPDVGVASVASAAGSTSCKSSPRKLKTWLLGTSTISATSSGAMPRSNMPRWRTNAGNTWEPPFVIGFPCATTDKQKSCDSRPSMAYDVQLVQGGKIITGPWSRSTFNESSFAIVDDLPKRQTMNCSCL